MVENKIEQFNKSSNIKSNSYLLFIPLKNYDLFDSKEKKITNKFLSGLL